jgi:hypothetical protein
VGGRFFAIDFFEGATVLSDAEIRFVFGVRPALTSRRSAMRAPQSR